MFLLMCQTYMLVYFLQLFGATVLIIGLWTQFMYMLSNQLYLHITVLKH